MFGGTLTEFATSLVDDIATRETVVADVDEDIVDAIRGALLLRSVVDDALARLAAQAARVGTAKRSGMSEREVLCRNGAAPAAASRYIRVGRAIGVVEGLTRLSRDGSLSSEHVDAIVRGIDHVARRTGEPIGSDLIDRVERSLTATATAGASPAEVLSRARAAAIEHTATADPEDESIPVAENPVLNDMGYTRTADGRLRGEFDLDAVTAERLVSAIDAGSKPRPEPDGSDDPRPAALRRADAFAQLIECGTRNFAVESAPAPPRSELILTMPVGVADLDSESTAARLQWMGPISDFAAKLASCDAAVTGIGHDLDGAPLDISATRRLFTGAVRKQIEWRDQSCVKCGAPASWTDCHHIVHFADGGPTTVDNGCLLCRSCHTAVHHSGWDVVMGHDRHPWLIPPASIDPFRRPLPAYNRRTLQLDDRLTAA
ncbi:hypothetical protein ASG12_19505 [Williamsia sp. Leaf354]|jgi:hypothetical protein|uniref:HNH endonuclease n=1 Tax=Williamsia sp. Leaf354 TaxID=1736349 RepID=UPI0006FA65AE|nr:HNH endonuclease signature motif containing protein [Williamsia sp. Leaf354]KQR96357.1 hypothetical protein ASG12_19505 [Williamsia sp. Leaf354]